MKKILTLILTISLLVCALASCSIATPEKDSVGNVTFVIATETPQVYDVPLSLLSDEAGLLPVFEYLNEHNDVEYDVMGTMINGIGGLENDYEKGSYVYIYTSVEKDFDVSEYKMEIEYEGKTLVSSGVGFNEMTLVDGAIIYVGLISWG